MTVSAFGTTRDGTAVRAIGIGAGNLRAQVITLGAVLREVGLDGVAHSLTLGLEGVAEYEATTAYFGAVVGPVANRIGGAAAVVDGRTCRFDANEGARVTLHSGPTGAHARVWDLAEVAADVVVLQLSLRDGLGGFPGNRMLTARYSVHPPATLRLELSAETDAPTLMNPAQHGYWNMDGTAHWSGHTLRIAAERYVPVGTDLLPRGAVLPVGGTPMDFRAGRRLVPGAPPIDTNFCLSDAPAPLREVAWLSGRSGVSMAIATTAPGLQVYDGRAAVRPGGGGYEGIALEPQHWPDAPNHPRFPPILMQPDEVWRQVSEWRFRRA